MKCRLVGVFLFVYCSAGLYAQNSVDITNYVIRYKETAIAEMKRTGIPASITLAQGIHETEAGTSDLVKKSNNHFGIKCKDSWTGPVVYHDDDKRGECFRSYADAEQSYKDHSDFLRASPRYQFLFSIDPLNYEGWAYGIKKAGYATNINYSQILIKLIRDYNLQQYTLIALGKLSADTQSNLTVSNPQPLDSLSPYSVAAQAANPDSIAEKPSYPEDPFLINQALVVFAKSGTSLLAIADQFQVPLARLLEFNELTGEEVLIKDQLVFLRRKRKQGATTFHLVRRGETIYDIAQAEGIRLESLLALNGLSKAEEVAAYEKLYLQGPASAKPRTAEPQQLGVDQVLPGAFTHIVQDKETLYSISKRYGVEVEKIQQWNKLDSLSLRTGQELIIYRN